MPRHKKGTMVRLKTEEEHEDWRMDDTGNVAANHGWMFRVIRFQSFRHTKNDTGEDEYWCKSLASGEELALYPREITTKEKDNDRQEEGSSQAATQVRQDASGATFP